jgi:hypothetical protein
MKTQKLLPLFCFLFVFLSAFSAAGQSVATKEVKMPSTEPISLEYPDLPGEPFIILRGDRLTDVVFVASDKQPVFHWSDTRGKGYYKVIVKMGELPKDIYKVVVQYGDGKTRSYVVRNDGLAF